MYSKPINQMTTKKTAETLTFTRNLKASKNGKVVVSFIAHPYCTGVHVTTGGGGQMSFQWKGFEKFVKKVIKDMAKDNLTVETYNPMVKEYLNIEDINSYILSK